MIIGLISDTHGWIHPRLYDFFDKVDQIWHAGDIGSLAVLDALEAFRPLKAVYGNIDGADIRRCVPAHQMFAVEDIRVWITHIGGTPGNYDKRVRESLYQKTCDLFVCGHSHITRIEYDKRGSFMYMNPGAAGRSGFHKYITALRFSIDGKNIRDMEVIEFGERGLIID